MIKIVILLWNVLGIRIALTGWHEIGMILFLWDWDLGSFSSGSWADSSSRLLKVD